MALSDEIKEERSKLKDKPLRERLGYYLYYYKVWLIAGVFAAILLAVFIHDIIVNSKPVFLEAYLINTAVTTEDDFSLEDDFVKYDSIDLKEYNINIDSSLYLADEFYDQASMATMQKIIALLSAGDIDVIIAPKSCIKMYEDILAYSYLNEYLPPNMLEELTDKGFELYSSDYEDYTSMPIGIVLPNKGYIEKTYSYDENDPVIFTVACNSKNTEHSVDFLKMLLDSFE